jgi:hypothetical protein
MRKFSINNYLDLRLEDGKTNIYVNNKLFLHCKHILLNISIDEEKDFHYLDSVDDVIEKLGQSFKITKNKNINPNPEVIFWAHCSNLQVWYENNYDTCLIHSNLAFPLLRELVKAEDLHAIKVFKEEIAKRLESKNLNLIRFLLYNSYLDCLNKEESEIVIKQTTINLTEIITEYLRELLITPIKNFMKIKEIIDLIIFFDLKYNQSLIFRITMELKKDNSIYFIRSLIFHLNYKEFLNFKIPYGSFFIYFEKILNFIYENYPEIKDMVKIIDSGFLSGEISLDDKFSYGTISEPRIL